MNQHQGVPTTPPKYHQFNLSVIFHSFLEGCVCARVCARVCVCSETTSDSFIFAEHL